MSPFVRRVLAVIAALVSATVIVMLVEAAAAKLFPISGVDLTRREEIEAALRSGAIPTGTLVMVAGGWILAAFVGGTVALKVSREGGGIATTVFAVLFTAVCAVNLILIPHPVWMWFAGIVMVPLAAIIAGRDRSAG